jgi:glycosyltransferase involved in cell wall biosynthesis
VSELLVGITSCRDGASLELCLQSLQRTLGSLSYSVAVVDCGSEDGSVEVAERFGADVLTRPWSQSDALNWLLAQSRAKYTLLLHSDVVFLADNWYDRAVAKLVGDVVLVSPEDVGVGPMLRAAYGHDQPESSFLLWRTEAAHALRELKPRRVPHALRHGLPLRVVNLYHRHVTHNLPDLIEARGLRWERMQVLASPSGEPWYGHDVPPGAVWEPGWGELEYGFGNFYALDDEITHYHQWYSRHAAADVEPLNDDGIPFAFLSEGAARFRRDYLADRVQLPRVKSAP